MPAPTGAEGPGERSRRCPPPPRLAPWTGGDPGGAGFLGRAELWGSRLGNWGSLMGWSADCRCEQGVGDTYSCSPQNAGRWRHLAASLQLCEVTPTAAAVGRL